MMSPERRSACPARAVLPAAIVALPATSTVVVAEAPRSVLVAGTVNVIVSRGPGRDLVGEVALQVGHDAAGGLAVLTLHGRDGQSQAQIVRDAYNRPEASLVELILAALLEAAMELQAVHARGALVAAEAG